MRIFVLYSRKAYTASDFDIENLEEYGRIDIIAQCLVQAMCLSYNRREDVIFYSVMGGKPNAPLTIEFVSSELEKIFPNEKFFAEKIKEALKMYEKTRKEEVVVENGIKIYRKDLVPLLHMIKERLNPKFFVLHENGEVVDKNVFTDTNCFIIGDNLGIPYKLEKYIIRKFNATKISLGKVSYLSSTCVSILNYLLDTMDLR